MSIFYCSRCTHSLIQLIMGNESGSDMVGKEQAMVIMNKTLQLIEKKGKVGNIVM